jgi:hypothetical protein
MITKSIEIETHPSCVGIPVGQNLEIKATVDFEIEDHSFDHEFGTEERHSVEISNVHLDEIALIFPALAWGVHRIVLFDQTEFLPLEDAIGKDCIEAIKATVCRSDALDWPDESDFREEYELQRGEDLASWAHEHDCRGEE